MNIQLIITLLVMLLMIAGFCAAGLNWDWWQ